MGSHGFIFTNANKFTIVAKLKFNQEKKIIVMFYLQQSYSEQHSAMVLLLGCRKGWFQIYFFLKGDGQSVHGLK